MKLHPFGLWVAVLFAAPMLVAAVQTSELPSGRTAVMAAILAVAGSLIAGLWETYSKEADKAEEEAGWPVVEGEELPGQHSSGPGRRRSDR